MTNEIHNSYKHIFYYSTASCPLYMFRTNFTRSSSGARHIILYHVVWYIRAGQSNCYMVVGRTAGTFVQASLTATWL